MFASKESIASLLDGVRSNFLKPGDLYLVGESSLVVEGIGDFCNEVILAYEVAQSESAALREVVDRAGQAEGLTVSIEHPADVIPLPADTSSRSRLVSGFEDNPSYPLRIRHYDPYSVAIRFIARGDEPDYMLALSLLENGWISMDQFEHEIQALLPRFSYDTIQQDPAEFRRKLKGLFQMYNAYARE
jgi:hypothetical protein